MFAVNLDHRHHRGHRFLHLLRIRVADHLREQDRVDLPGHAELVGDPPACDGRAAFAESRPVAIDFILRLALDGDGDPLLKVNCGPPLSATNSRPSSVKLTVITVPALNGNFGPRSG